jgi:GNAT superfamily N-acetyltransferase
MASAPIIRLGTMADVSALPGIEAAAAALFKGTHAEAFATGPTSHINTLLRAQRSGLLWVAGHSAAQKHFTPAGFLFGAACPEGLYLQEMSVGPQAQRQGLGAALMHIAIAHARSEGLATILLTTDRTLPWNAPFYARLGFTILEGPAIPDTLKHRLARQAADGIDMAHRCAMQLQIS